MPFEVAIDFERIELSPDSFQRIFRDLFTHSEGEKMTSDCRSMRLFIVCIHDLLCLSLGLNNLSTNAYRNRSSVTHDHSSIG